MLNSYPEKTPTIHHTSTLGVEVVVCYSLMGQYDPIQEASTNHWA